MGTPGLGYRFPWLVNKWITGHNSSPDFNDDLTELAKDLAGFLNTLMSIDATDASEPGRVNYRRGCDPFFYDCDIRRCLGKLGKMLDVRAAAAA